METVFRRGSIGYGLLVEWPQHMLRPTGLWPSGHAPPGHAPPGSKCSCPTGP